MPHTLRVTTLGLYHISRLCNLFEYVDAVILDTPILDSGVRDVIQDVLDIDSRLERAECFRSYLDVQWSEMNMQGLGFDWNNSSASLKQQITRIRNRLKKIT